MLRHIFILGLVVAARTLSGQAPAVEASEQPLTLRVTADLVLLDVSVKSVTGEHVSGLAKNDFKVYEDGRLQTVSHFASEDVPVTAGLVIDTSGSMRSKRVEVITAALVFIAASNKSDELFVVHFSDGVSLGLPPDIPFSGDTNQLRSALWTGTAQGRTALNDAIVFALGHLQQGRRDRRALVLVSDGGDNSSVHGTEDVMRTVLESRATIYTIGIFDQADEDRNPGLLNRLARISGGESFLEVQLSEISGICRQIASDIRTRYTIGYVPIRSGEGGSSRKIKVIASAPGGHKLVVHTRSSYIVPPQPVSGGQDSDPSRKAGQ